MPATILGLNGSTAATAANAFPVQLYDASGNAITQPYLGEYYLAQSIPQFTAALAANTAVWAIRNGATRKMKLIITEATMGFAGTAAASSMQMSIRRFTTATPTGGTALTTLVTPEDSAMSATTIADARCATAAAGLTTTGAVIGNPIFVGVVPRSVTGAVFNFEMSRDLVLNPNEGVLVQYDTVGVIGDVVGITMYWGEY